MAGVTDLPFRMLCREQGADFLFTEMVSAKAVLYGNRNTDLLLRTDPAEGPTAVQLFGSDPRICAEIALRLEDAGWKYIDFNMGCPVPKIVNNGEGSALMKDPQLAAEIISAVTDRVSVPVSVKIRAGFDSEHINAPEMAVLLEQAGACAITVHARTREQYYHGKADWSIIRSVKEKVGIPVIGNGDVDSPDEAERMAAETGCDAVMIARGALGNPWVFSGKIPEPCELMEMMLRHLELQVSFDGEYAGVREMRKHLAWYTHGMKNSGAFRDEINRIEEYSVLKERIIRFFEKTD